jgi:GAF domain-containing protein
LLGEAAEAGRLTSISAQAEAPRVWEEVTKLFGANTRSLLCIPLTKEKDLLPGLVMVLNKRYGFFNREDEELARAVANQIAIVLREGRLF